MKRFIKKILYFILPPFVALSFIEVLLPDTFFGYRPWEGLQFATIIPHDPPFYPNRSVAMNSVGDLCHHTDYSIIRKEKWIIDKLGFRNDKFIEEPDVVIVGDSYVVGTGLDQESTLPNQLIRISKKKVYGMANISVAHFDMYLKSGQIRKPRLLIYAMAERSIPDVFTKYEDISPGKLVVKQIFKTMDANVYLDKAFRYYSLKWIKARITGKKGSGVAAEGYPGMFFLQGATQKHNPEDLSITVSTIQDYYEYCKSMGMRFLFVPIPDKETLYWQNVPFKEQPGYLLALDSALQSKNIPAINTLQLFNNYKESEAELLYQLDDSHWNANGTRLMAEEINRWIKMDD